MTLLLLFAYTPLAPSVPISELVQSAPLPGVGYPIQRPASSGEWRFGLELADPQAGDSIVWHDITQFYAGDVYQRGADDYLGKYRAAVAQVELQTDNDDLAPWGQDTSALFGTNVELDGGLLMRATLFRVAASATVEWTPIWTGRVETWGDASAARGQIRTHVVTVTDTIADLANVPTVITGNNVPHTEWLTENLNGANWLFGVDFYGDTDDTGMLQDLTVVAAINRMDQGTDPWGLVWRSRRTGRLIVYPAAWDTTNTDRWPNPLLDVYPSGLVFSYSPDFTDIAYIDDDDQQPFGIQRTSLGVLNSFLVTTPSDLFALDDPVSMARYGVRPFTATWVANGGEQVVDDLLVARAYSSSQALPLRTTLDQDGFWSAMSLIDQFDPVTVVHATSETGDVVTAVGTVRNVMERRTVRGEGTDTMLLSWESTVQVDIQSDEVSPALLPVENLVWVSSESPGNAGPSSAEFTWDNPVQPDVTPTEVQLRVLPRSLIWSSEDYPGVGADGTTLNWLDAGQWYTLQVRLVRRVNGVITAVSAIRSVKFPTPNRIFPIPVPDDTDTDVEVGEPPDFDDEDCEIELELQEQTIVGGAWVTVESFDESDLIFHTVPWTDSEGGTHPANTWSLLYPIPFSFWNVGSMYRYRSREICGTVIGEWINGTSFDPPDDWTDPCTEPPALSDPPFTDPSLLVYVPKVCAPDIIREAVSGLEAVHGPALDSIVSIGGDPDSRALQAIADPAWSDTPGGILAYGECPQINGATGDKTMTVRTSIADNSFAVLFECANMRITAAPSGADWIAGATFTSPDGVISLLSGALDLDTIYVITSTFTAATGDVALYVDGVLADSDSYGVETTTSVALPIWRVGAPPESWVTDCALFDAVFTDALTLPAAILALGPTRYYTCEQDLPFPDLGSLNLDTTSAAGAYTEGGEVGGDGRNYLDMTGTTDIRAGYDIIGSFKPNQDQTLLVFLKPDAVTGAARFILQQGDGTNRRGFIYIDDTLAKLWYAGQSNTATAYYAATNSSISAGTWAMWTFRQQGATYEWRKNNADVTGASVVGSAEATAMNAFRLGGADYAGGIAHVATWDRFLTPTELTSIYNAAVADGWSI